MTKKLTSIISISMLSILVIFIIISRLMSHNYEYSMGKDSHKAFGNGEYQILTKNNLKDVKEYSLYNMKYKETIIESVQGYKKKANYIYFYGIGADEIFVLLNVDDNKIIYYSASDEDHLIYYNKMIEDNVLQTINSFEKFKDEDQKVFKKLII